MVVLRGGEGDQNNERTNKVGFVSDFFSFFFLFFLFVREEDGPLTDCPFGLLSYLSFIFIFYLKRVFWRKQKIH